MYSLHDVIYDEITQQKILEEAIIMAKVSSNGSKKEFKAKSFTEHLYMILSRFMSVFKKMSSQKEKNGRSFMHLGL